MLKKLFNIFVFINIVVLTLFLNGCQSLYDSDFSLAKEKSDSIKKINLDGKIAYINDKDRGSLLFTYKKNSNISLFSADLKDINTENLSLEMLSNSANESIELKNPLGITEAYIFSYSNIAILIYNNTVFYEDSLSLLLNKYFNIAIPNVAFATLIEVNPKDSNLKCTYKENVLNSCKQTLGNFSLDISHIKSYQNYNIAFDFSLKQDKSTIKGRILNIRDIK